MSSAGKDFQAVAIGIGGLGIVLAFYGIFLFVSWGGPNSPAGASLCVMLGALLVLFSLLVGALGTIIKRMDQLLLQGGRDVPPETPAS